MLHGLRPVTRNYRCRQGELDLIMRHGRTLVVVEVRLRNHPRWGTGIDSVSHRKRQRILRATHHYLRRHDEHRNRPLRFDVVSVSRPNYRFRHQWVRNAFTDD